MNEARRRANLLCIKSESVQLADHMQKQPVNMYVLVKSVDDHRLEVLYSTTPVNTVLPTTLNLELVNPPGSSVNVIPSELMMEGVVVEMPLNVHINDLVGFPSEVWPRFVAVPAQQWLNLVDNVKQGDQTAIMEAAINANESLDNSQAEGCIVVQQHSDNNQSTVTKVKISAGNLAKVQLCGGVVRGVLQPTVQLLSLSPQLTLCLEHKTRPLDCFVNTLPTTPASQQSYPDINTYEKKWLPLIHLEAADTINTQVKPTIVNNVLIKWHKV